MPESINEVTIMGNLGRDPEIRTFQNGGKLCNLRVATSKRWKDRETGEKKERTEWHSVAIYVEPTVRFCEQYLRKGQTVWVRGELETRKWQDQSGQDRYTTEVAVRPYGGKLIKITDDRDSRGDGGGGYEDRGGSYGGTPAGDRQDPPSQDLDDEIPF